MVIDAFHDGVKVHRHIIGDREVEVLVEHRECLLRSALGVCCIAFLKDAVSRVQIGIAVDGNELYLVRLVIDRCEHDNIASSLGKIAVRTVIKTEESDRLVICHRVLRLFGKSFVDVYIIKIQFIFLYF